MLDYVQPKSIHTDSQTPTRRPSSSNLMDDSVGRKSSSTTTTESLSSSLTSMIYFVILVSVAENASGLFRIALSFVQGRVLILNLTDHNALLHHL